MDNLGLRLGQAQYCGWVKPVNGQTSSSDHLGLHISWLTTIRKGMDVNFFSIYLGGLGYYNLLLQVLIILWTVLKTILVLIKKVI